MARIILDCRDGWEGWDPRDCNGAHNDENCEHTPDGLTWHTCPAAHRWLINKYGVFGVDRIEGGWNDHLH